MIFETYTPGPPLDAIVETMIYFRGFVPDHSIERVVPTGHVFALFELDGMTRNTFDNRTLEPNAEFTRAWVSGMQRHYISISAHDDSEMLAVQFKSGGTYPIFHVPMHTLAERVIPGADILDGELLPLRDGVLSAETPGEKFSLVEAWLVERLDEGLIPPPEVDTVIKSLQNNPASRFATIVSAYPGSQKHLIDQFKKFVGLTPKAYQRVLRFNEVFSQMQASRSLSWADIADRCGYSDQSHFIREFKTFSGFNPEEFIRQGFDDEQSNFFPLDRQG